MAAILALAHSLLPGFCFLIDDDDEDDGYRLVTSSGTRAPAANGRRSQANQLHDKSHDSGETVVADRRVRWFQLASQRGFSIAEDGRGTTELLRESLTLTVEESRIPGLVMRINGIVGGMLSKDERAQTESQALAVLEHRFEMDPELQHLMAVPGFQLYLRRKAADRVNRCSSLRFAGQVRAGRRCDHGCQRSARRSGEFEVAGGPWILAACCEVRVRALSRCIQFPQPMPRSRWSASRLASSW